MTFWRSTRRVGTGVGSERTVPRPHQLASRNDKRMRVLIIVCLAAGILTGTHAITGTWTTIDRPGAAGTYISDADGACLVGVSLGDNGLDGFLFDGTDWMTFEVPGAAGTNPYAIDSGRIVGQYNPPSLPASDHGFLFDGAAFATLDVPGAEGTWLHGMQGQNIVGRYFADGYHGVLYDGTAWTTIDVPGSYYTDLDCIDAGRLGGSFRYAEPDDHFTHGFILDGTTWTFLDAPGALETHVTGIHGNIIVGSYNDGPFGPAAVWHGFLYDGTGWTTLDFPDAADTFVSDIEDGILFGHYKDSSGVEHGFSYTIPEPATLSLLALGGLAASCRRVRG